MTVHYKTVFPTLYTSSEYEEILFISNLARRFEQMTRRRRRRPNRLDYILSIVPTQ